jgi:Ca-activated chloride channel family protein
MMSFFPEADDGYFLMDINPGNLTNDLKPQPKDITFIIDVSGSMEGKKLVQAKKALSYCLNKLSPDDRFDVIRFSTEATALFGKPEPNNQSNHKRGDEFVSSLQELGGTNIEDAFEVALNNQVASDRPHVVLFITDGKPTIGETNADRLSKRVAEINKGRSRIFSVGIGYDLHTGLLDKIADESNGFRTYIAPEEDLEIKISDVYNKISKPVLTDIRIRADRSDLVFDVYPKKIPDMFAGSGIMLMGRCKQAGTVKLTLSGRYLGKEITVDKQIVLKQDASKSDFIPALWATRKVGWLLDQIRLNGESDELKKEVVSISKKFGIVTPYTSYLIMEDEQRPDNIVVRDQHTIRHIPLPAEKSSEYQESYKGLTQSSGRASTESSTAVQFMNQTGNLQQVVLSKNKSDKKDTVSPNDNESVTANGKTFYRNGSNWVDSGMPTTDNIIGKKVKFASDEYFKLAQDQNIKVWLAIARNVSFNYRGINYEIVD